MWVPVRLDFDMTREGQSSILTTDWRAHASMLYQGSDFSASFSVSVGGAATDFSNRTWTLRIVDASRGVTLLTLDGPKITGDNTGRVSISIPSALTANLDLGAPTRYLNAIGLSDFVYSLDATDSSGGVIRVAEGIFVVSHDVQ